MVVQARSPTLRRTLRSSRLATLRNQPRQNVFIEKFFAIRYHIFEEVAWPVQLTSAVSLSDPGVLSAKLSVPSPPPARQSAMPEPSIRPFR